MLKTYITRFLTFCGSGIWNLAAAVNLLVLGLALAFIANVTTGQPWTALKPAVLGIAAILTGLGIGALADITMFQDWKRPASQNDPIEQMRRCFIMGLTSIAMAIFAWHRF